MTRLHRCAALAAMLICIAAPALAADPPPSPFACRPDGNQQEMNACADQDFAATDKRLNATYQGLVKTLPPAEVIKLRAAQHVWLKRRDPTCKQRTKGSEGGSIWPLEYQSCRTELTEARVKVLEAMRRNTQ